MRWECVYVFFPLHKIENRSSCLSIVFFSMWWWLLMGKAHFSFCNWIWIQISSNRLPHLWNDGNHSISDAMQLPAIETNSQPSYNVRWHIINPLSQPATAEHSFQRACAHSLTHHRYSQHHHVGPVAKQTTCKQFRTIDTNSCAFVYVLVYWRHNDDHTHIHTWNVQWTWSGLRNLSLFHFLPLEMCLCICVSVRLSFNILCWKPVSAQNHTHTLTSNDNSNIHGNTNSCALRHQRRQITYNMPSMLM